MDLKVVREQLLTMGERIGMKLQEEDGQKLIVHAQLQAKDYFDNVIYLRIVVFATGTMHMFLTFDPLEKTYDNLFLVNTLNAENPWFRAYITNINDKDYLELHYTGITIEKEESITDVVGYLLNELLNENTFKYLSPILKGNKESIPA